MTHENGISEHDRITEPTLVDQLNDAETEHATARTHLVAAHEVALSELDAAHETNVAALREQMASELVVLEATARELRAKLGTGGPKRARTSAPPSQARQVPDERPLRERVMGWMAHNPAMSLASIAEGIGAPRPQVKRELAAMRAEGHAVSAGAAKGTTYSLQAEGH